MRATRIATSPRACSCMLIATSLILHIDNAFMMFGIILIAAFLAVVANDGAL